MGIDKNHPRQNIPLDVILANIHRTLYISRFALNHTTPVICVMYVGA